jgi:hypothetical protein
MGYRYEDIVDVSSNPIDFGRWLVRERFVPGGDRRCSHCNSGLNMQCTWLHSIHQCNPLRADYAGSADGVVWRCVNEHCHRQYSIRVGSIFERSHFSLLQQCKIVCDFCDEVSITTCSRQMHVPRKHVGQYYARLRGLWRRALEDNPIVFLLGNTFESDEMQLKHVLNDETGHYEDLWIQSISERETGAVRLLVLPNRSGDSLCGNLQLLLPPNALVFTDDWPGYLGLIQRGFRHYTVNHSAGEYTRRQRIGGRNLLVHCNTCEGHHRVLRKKLLNKQIRSTTVLPAYIREYEYRHSGRSLWDPFKV